MKAAAKEAAGAATDSLPAEVAEVFANREKARQNKDWAASDQLRDQLATLGYEVSDSSTGQTIKKK